MKRALLTLSLLISALASPILASAQDKKPVEKKDIILPDTTCVYAIKGTDTLRMDIYYPKREKILNICPMPGPISKAIQATPVSQPKEIVYRQTTGPLTHYNGKEKPTILYIFGGGFAVGEKDAILQLRWYKKYVENGFRIIAIDYRLGLKDINNEHINKLKIVKKLKGSLDMAVEDLYTATNFLIEHGKELGIDPNNLVISGASAGAMTSLQADYELCNRDKFNVPLPEGFRYKGVISFSGGVTSKEGKPDYRTGTPAPTLLFHGIDDRIVNYKQLRFFHLGFFGSDKLAKRLEKYQTNYRIYRYQDCGHEVAASFNPTVAEQFDFIYDNVMEGKKKVIDATLDDPGIDARFKVKKYKDIYQMTDNSNK